MFSLSTSKLAYLILALAVVALVVTGTPRVSPLVIVDASGPVAPSLDYLVNVPISSWPEAALDDERLMARWLEAREIGDEAIMDLPLEEWPEAALDDERLVGRWLEYHTLAGGYICGGQGSRLCIERAMEYLATAQGDAR